MLTGAERRSEPGAELHRWYRSYGLLLGLAVGLFGTAVLVAASYNLPLRDPDDTLVGPVYFRLPAIAVGCFLIDVLVRSIRRGGLLTLRTTIPVILRERWPAPRIRLVLVGLVSWYLTYVAFRNLKSYVPFVQPHLMDDTLLRIDRVLAFGHDPATVLHDLLGTGVAAHLMSLTYVSWILFLSLSLLIALFWTQNLDTASWYVTAVAVNWVLGVALYYLVPSVGPVYARPELFADLPDLATTRIADSWMADRVEMLADPFGTPALQTVAAFASLHVSVMVTAVLISRMGRLRPVSVQWALWFFLVLNVLATVYLGWHYVVDVLGGVAIGVAAVWIAAYGTGNRHRLPTLMPRRGRRHEGDRAATAQGGDVPPQAHGYRRSTPERFWTAPTVVTLLRTIGSLGVTALALGLRSTPLLFAGLAIYWLGDIIDGWLARRLDQETRVGAVADIVSDRLSAGSFYAGVVWLDIAPALPVAVYLAEFMVVDLLLSLAFLAWPLVSPNYFYLVDRWTWRINWSPVAKSINSAAFLVLLLLTGDPVLATWFAVALLIIKGGSLARVMRMDLPNVRTRTGAGAGGRWSGVPVRLLTPRGRGEGDAG